MELARKFLLEYVIKADKNIVCSHQYLRGDVLYGTLSQNNLNLSIQTCRACHACLSTCYSICLVFVPDTRTKARHHLLQRDRLGFYADRPRCRLCVWHSVRLSYHISIYYISIYLYLYLYILSYHIISDSLCAPTAMVSHQKV